MVRFSTSRSPVFDSSSTAWILLDCLCYSDSYRSGALEYWARLSQSEPSMSSQEPRGAASEPFMSSQEHRGAASEPSMRSQTGPPGLILGPLGASASRGAPQPANGACEFMVGSFNFELPGALPSALGLSEPAWGLCWPALGCSWPPLGLLWDSQESLERCFSACLAPALTNIENLCPKIESRSHFGSNGCFQR